MNEAAILAVKAGDAMVRAAHVEHAVSSFKASRAAPPHEHEAQSTGTAAAAGAAAMEAQIRAGVAMLHAMGVMTPAPQPATVGSSSVLAVD
jgi:hypothetical protein